MIVRGRATGHLQRSHALRYTQHLGDVRMIAVLNNNFAAAVGG